MKLNLNLVSWLWHLLWSPVSNIDLSSRFVVFLWLCLLLLNLENASESMQIFLKPFRFLGFLVPSFYFLGSLPFSSKALFCFKKCSINTVYLPKDNRCRADIEEKSVFPSDSVVGEAVTWDGNPPTLRPPLLSEVLKPSPGRSPVCYYCASSHSFILWYWMFGCWVSHSEAEQRRRVSAAGRLSFLQKSSPPDQLFLGCSEAWEQDIMKWFIL